MIRDRLRLSELARLPRLARLRRTPRHVRRRTSDAVRLASYPPPYPDGWYRLLETDDLRPG